MSHEKGKRLDTTFYPGEGEQDYHEEEEWPQTSSRPSEFSFGDDFVVTKSRKDKQADQKLKNQEKQELKAAEKIKELERAAAAVATKRAQDHEQYLKLKSQVKRESDFRNREKLLGNSVLANYKDPDLTDETARRIYLPYMWTI